MKKTTKRFSYNVPSGFCAPEQFRLNFRMSDGKTFEVFTGNKNNIGYLAYTDKEEMQKELKRYIRNKTIFNKKENKRKIVFELSNGDWISDPHDYIYQYDIKEKLRLYKEAKKYISENQNLYNVRTGIMVEYGKMEEVKTEQEPVFLTGKFYLQ